jgi:hypothetical protein
LHNTDTDTDTNTNANPDAITIAEFNSVIRE